LKQGKTEVNASKPANTGIIQFQLTPEEQKKIIERVKEQNKMVVSIAVEDQC
jgi:dihydroorotate dehydrogenase